MLCLYMKCVIIANVYWILSINAQYREESNQSGITVVALKKINDYNFARSNFKLMNNKYNNDQNSKYLIQSEDMLNNDLNDLDANKLTETLYDNEDISQDLPQNTRRFINNLFSNDDLRAINGKQSLKDFERMTDTNVTESPQTTVDEVTKETDPPINTTLTTDNSITDTNEQDGTNGQDIVLHKILEAINAAHLKFISDIETKSTTTTETYEKTIVENTTKPSISIEKKSETPPKALIEVIIKHEFPYSNQPHNEHNIKTHINNVNNNHRYPHYLPSIPTIPQKYSHPNQFPFGYQGPLVFKHLLNIPKPVHNQFFSYAPPQNFRPQTFFPIVRSYDVPQKPRYQLTNDYSFIIKDM